MADAPVTARYPANQSPWALVAALPLSSGEGPRAPIPKLEQSQLTASGEAHDNQQPGNEEEQAIADDEWTNDLGDSCQNQTLWWQP